MPRKSRKELRGKFFHIVAQGLNKEYIFDKESYIQKYKNCMYEKLKKIDVVILAYCIMSNHIHILIYSEDISKISKYMQIINTTYSQFYNRMEKRIGYVFKDRFFSQEIYDKRQLWNCLRYIHYNPVKAKICKQLSDYRHSSYNEFLKNKYIITDKSIDLLFDNRKDYMNSFYTIHTNYKEEFIVFDVKEMKIEDFVKKFEQENKIEINSLKEDKKILQQLIKEARNTTEVTLEELAEILGVSKSTVANYEKK